MIRRSLAVLAFVVLSLASFAQSNDQLSFASFPDEPHAGHPFTLALQVFPLGATRAVVDWTLPDAAFQWIDPRCVPQEGRRYRCTLASIAPGTVSVLRAGLIAPGGVSFAGTNAFYIEPASTSPSPRNEDITIRTATKLVPKITMPDELAWLNGEAPVTLELDPVVPPSRLLRPVRVRLSIESLVRYEAPPGWSCTSTDRVVECEVSDVTRQTLVAYGRRAGDRLASALASVRWQEFDYEEENVVIFANSYPVDRQYVVTTSADSGAGSLREALLDAQTCPQEQRCRIVFADDVTTIDVLSPLPPITANAVTIDGKNKVVLDGRTLTNGNGLAVAATTFEARILGLEIRSFASNGIECHGRGIVQGCTLTGNALRGISSAGIVEIENNTISGNWRSGIFIEAGGQGFARNNRIGVAADGVSPDPNGASGIFVGPQAFSGKSFIAEGNVIAYNKDFGIAIAREQVRVLTAANEVFANRIGDIDVGLDGPQRPGVTIDSAQYDAASNSTFFFGTIEHPARLTLFLHAGDRRIGELDVANEKFFVFRAEGDQTGLPIRASFIAQEGFPEFYYYRTSELTEPAVPVHSGSVGRAGELLPGSDAHPQLPLQQ
jgi:parallel beta-helix repeat protein